MHALPLQQLSVIPGNIDVDTETQLLAALTAFQLHACT